MNKYGLYGGVVLNALLCLNAAASDPGATATVSREWKAIFSKPTDRYGHNVLGNTVEWGMLCLTHKKATGCATLPKNEVFEDIYPRLADVDNDGDLEAVVVKSHKHKGAALVIYDLVNGELNETSTPHIGTRFRWLAPIGIADFNGDGNIDVAYIDRPHLAKTLRVWTFKDDALTETANITGLSNHRIGENFISGGVRTCDGTPEMITADAAWKRVIATRFENGKLTKTDLGPFKGKRSFKRALTC